jgi:hypothetical protein
MDSVRNSLRSRGEDVEGFILKLIQEPIIRPDCSALHKRKSNEGQRLATAQKFPDAYVLVDIYRGEEHREQALVVFRNQESEVRFSGQKSQRPAFSEDDMDVAEFEEVAKGLDEPLWESLSMALLTSLISGFFRRTS